MSNSDIEEQLREIYDFRLSTSTISNITAKIQQDVARAGHLSRFTLSYGCLPAAGRDGIVFKVRQSGKVINKTIYLAVGLNRDGKKEVLGMWLGRSGKRFILVRVLSDMQGGV